jgi:hypothetical protein
MGKSNVQSVFKLLFVSHLLKTHVLVTWPNQDSSEEDTDATSWQEGQPSYVGRACIKGISNYHTQPPFASLPDIQLKSSQTSVIPSQPSTYRVVHNGNFQNYLLSHYVTVPLKSCLISCLIHAHSLVLFCFCFWARVFLCSPGWPWTCNHSASASQLFFLLSFIQNTYHLWTLHI